MSFIADDNIAQLQVAQQVVNTLGERSFWVSPSKNAVYGVYLYSPYAFPNYEHPYQLRIIAYAPNYSFYADTQFNVGGVALDGTIAFSNTLDAFRGQLINPNQIMWNDGSIWYRTQLPPNNTINQYSARSAYEQSADLSTYFNTIYNRAYPNIYRYIPF